MWLYFQQASNRHRVCASAVQVGAWEVEEKPAPSQPWGWHDFIVRCGCGEVGIIRFDDRDMKVRPDKSNPHWKFSWLRHSEGGLIGWNCGLPNHRARSMIEPLKTEAQLLKVGEVQISGPGVFLNPLLD